ncbi:MAG: hypothetical protein ACTSVV_12875 [Promethearchaeota archaeon]
MHDIKKGANNHLDGVESSNDKNADAILNGSSLERLNLSFEREFNSNLNRIFRPQFLGSIHLKRDIISRSTSTMDSLLANELSEKINKAIKNSMLNPITKMLIIITILFNIFWILYFYILK